VKAVKAVFLLARWPNCLLTMASVITAAFLLPRIPTTLKMILAAISASSIAASGNIHNDLVDRQADIINHPERPLPQGAIALSAAVRTAIAFLIAGLIMASLVNWYCLILALAAAAILFAYNSWLKGVPLLSNAMIAALAMLAFLFGGFLDPDFNPGESSLVSIGGIFAFWFHLAREIIKDFQDIEGDRAGGIRTLANCIPAAGKGLVMLSIAGIFLSFIYFQIFLKPRLLFQVIFLFGIMIPLLVIAIWLWPAHQSREYGRIAAFMKILMPVGLLALLSARF
jgi:geranylgeranylglycerol-phosphate geranylgeranyltransferase